MTLRDSFFQAERLKQRRPFKGRGLEPFLSGAPFVLDVGCGLGYDLLSVAHLFSVGLGLDIDRQALEFANAQTKLRGADNLQFVCADALHLPLRSRTFSIVISFDFLEHTTTPVEALSQLAGLVRPGGFLIVGSPNKWSASEIAMRLYSPVERRRTCSWHVRHVSFLDVGFFMKNLNEFSMCIGILRLSLVGILFGFVFTFASVLVNVMFPPLRARSLLVRMGGSAGGLVGASETRTFIESRVYFGCDYFILVMQKGSSA